MIFSDTGRAKVDAAICMSMDAALCSHLQEVMPGKKTVDRVRSVNSLSTKPARLIVSVITRTNSLDSIREENNGDRLR